MASRHPLLLKVVQWLLLLLLAADPFLYTSTLDASTSAGVTPIDALSVAPDQAELLGDVSIIESGFVPQVLTVTVGMTVTWTNDGTSPHQVVYGIPPGGGGTPSPIPTIPTTATASSTPFPTATATQTVLPSTTATPSPTVSATATVAPTSSATSTTAPTVTSTVVSTGTVTTTPEPTIPTTETPVPTATGTEAPSATITATGVPSATPTTGTPRLYLPLIRVAGTAPIGLTSVPESSTPPAPASIWDSGILQPGQSYNRLFDTVGDFAYYDALNPTLTGRIVVVPPVVVNDPPGITIVTPGEGAIVAVGMLTVTGMVTDSNPIASVTVNGMSATLNGTQFQATIPVTDGSVALHATAMDELGGSGTASRTVQVDGAGPAITISAPMNGQAVYTNQPATSATFADFLSTVNPATFSALLTDASGTIQDVTADLTVTTTTAQGTLSTPLAEDAVYTLTLTIRDTFNNLGSVQSLFYVPDNPGTIIPPSIPDEAGWISGRIYDSSTCNEHLTTCEGIAGVFVTLQEIDPTAVAQARAARQSAIQAQRARGEQMPALPPSDPITSNLLLTGTVVTGPDGFFAFPVADTAIYWLRAEKDGYTYSQREAEIVKERSTAASNIYLTPLDPAVTTCDTTGCTHINSTGSMQIIVPPGAIPTGETRDLSATPFEQVEFLPSGELPPGTWETYAFNLGGASEITFTLPVTVRQANSLGFAPGTEVPLGYWNQNTLAWEHAGTGTVDPTGQWVEMPVTHFSNYDCNDPIAAPDVNPDATLGEEEIPCSAGEEGCFINLQSGQFEEWVRLPSVQVLNESVAPELRYSTARANPSAVIDIDLSVNAVNQSEIGDYIQYELFIEGEQTDNFTFVLSKTEQTGRFRYYWDGRNAQGERLPPGIYEYTVVLGVPFTGQYCYAQGGIFGNPPDCITGATGVFVDAIKDVVIRGTVVLEATPGDPFGAGWVLDGQQTLLEDEDGRILITDGRRRDEFYFPFRDLIVNQPPVAELPLTWINQDLDMGGEGQLESYQSVAERVARDWQGKEIIVGDGPEAVLLSEDGTTAYITNFTSRTLSVVDVASGVQTNSFQIGRRPRAIVSPPGSNVAYIVSELDDNLSVVNLATQQFSDTISVGDGPRHLTLSADGTTAYVANYNNDTLSIVNLTTQQQVATIPAGNAPQFVDISPDGTLAYVINDIPSTISVLNLTTQTFSETITVNNSDLYQLAFAPDGNTVYVADNVNGLHLLAVATEQITETIGGFFSPRVLILSPDGTRAYVGATTGLDALTVVDLPSRTITANYRVCQQPSGIALSADETFAYVTCRIGDRLRTIPLAEHAAEITTYDGLNDPTALALSSDATTAYVAQFSSFFSNSLRIMDVTTGDMGVPISVGGGLWDVTLSPDERYAYLATAFGIDVVDLQSETLLNTIATSGFPYAVKLSTDATTAYVAEAGTDQFLVIDLLLNTIVSTVAVGNFPRDVAVTANGTFAYLPNYDDDTLSVVNIPSESVITTIQVGDAPVSVTLSPDESRAYIANEFGGTVTVIDLNTNSVISTIPVAPQPTRVLLSPDGTIAYVGAEHGLYVVHLQTESIRGVISNDFDPVQDLAFPSASDAGIFSTSPTDFSTLEFDDDSGTYRRLYPDGKVIQFTPEGWHGATIEPNGKETRFTYDTEGRVLTMAIIPPGESSPRWTWAFAYSDGHLTTITDPAGRVTTATVNNAGHLESVTVPDGGQQQFIYSAEGLMTHHQDANGNTTQQVYDPYGRIEQIVEPPRPVYDSVIGTATVTQTVRTFTPSDTHYGLINESTVGDPDAPAPARPTSAEVIDRVEFERGDVSGHTNSFGNWLDRTDGVGRTTLYDYDERNNQTLVVEPDGDCRTMEYDAQGYLTVLKEGTGAACATDRTTTYTYEARFHQIKSVTDPLGNTTTLTYDYEEGVGEAGNLIRVEYPMVEDENGVATTPTIELSYNSWGLVETITDERGMVTHYVYTQGIPAEASNGATPLFLPGVTPVPGLLTQKIEDEGGINFVTVLKDFNGAGLPGVLIKPGGQNITTYEYDGMNRITTQTNAVGIVTTFAYDGRGNLTTKIEDFTPDGTTGRNVQTEYAYLPDAQPTLERTSADGLTVQTRTDYDVNGKVALREDGRGYRTVYTYDTADQLVEMTDAGGYTTTYSYTPDGQIETLTDPEGSVTRHVYDAYGREVTRVQDDGGLNLTTTYRYDANDNLLEETNADGVMTCYGYDALDRRSGETRDCGGLELTTTYKFTLTGEKAGHIDPRGIVTVTERDALNRPITQTEDAQGLSLATLYTYDTAGNLSTTTDPRGIKSAFGHDALNRMTSRCGDANGLNTCTTFIYDRLNRPATVTDPNGVITLLTFNAWGKKTSVIADAGGLNAPATYEYDAALNLIEVTDANGNHTNYSYGARNETIYDQYADGSTIAYTWNGRGHVSTRTDQAGAVIRYAYDGAGRMTQRVIGNEGIQHFTYDPMGRIRSAAHTMAGHTTTDTLTYDPLGQITTHVQNADGFTWSVGYAYDYNDGLVTTIYPSGTERRWTTDSLNRLTTVTDEGGATMATYTYAPTLDFDRLSYPNGLITQRDLDPLNRVTRVSSAVADYRYGYDSADHRLYQQRMHEPDQPADVYQYNALYQVTEVWYGADSTDPGTITTQTSQSVYDLDALHNRLTVTTDGVPMTYGPNNGAQLLNGMNRYETVGNATLSYDAIGNLVADGLNSLTYNGLSQLTAVDGATSDGSYVYNALGWRVAKIADGVATYFVHDRAHRILEERSSTNALLARYTYGVGADDLLMMERGGTTYFYHKDAQGSITEVTDAAGVLVERYQYDVYGGVLRFNGAGSPIPESLIGNAFLYTGRYYDAESGNYDFRARSYSPRLGRFLQMDPLGYIDDLNLYASYFAINATDPTGKSVSDDIEDHLDMETGGYTMLEEVELLSVAVYDVFGGGISVTMSGEDNDCCLNQKTIPGGDRKRSINITAEAGLGIGGTAQVAGFGVDLSWKGPQVSQQMTLSLVTGTCGGPFNRVETCQTVGIDLGSGVDAGYGPVSIGGELSVTGSMSLCGQSGPDGHGAVTLSFCAEASVAITYGISMASGNVVSATTGESCEEFKAKF